MSWTELVVAAAQSGLERGAAHGPVLPQLDPCNRGDRLHMAHPIQGIGAPSGIDLRTSTVTLQPSPSQRHPRASCVKSLLHLPATTSTMSLQIPHREKSNGLAGATKAVILVSCGWDFGGVRVWVVDTMPGWRRLARHPLPPSLARCPQGICDPTSIPCDCDSKR
jgi:hypothetical protein